jgi:NAD-dependent dihydropyrimidine dehydrogenase PreA subunit
MKVDGDTCIACGECVTYCPMGAISMQDDVAAIDEDECVECGICLRAKICPVEALIYEPTSWSRQLRAAFSNPTVKHPVTGLAGRGTEEVKTNEVTGRLKRGWLALAVEVGRPVTGARFRDVDTVAQALAREGVTFEEKSPVTALMEDATTGKIIKDALNEKVLSAIVECVFPREKGTAVLTALREATQKIDTVCSVVMADLVEADGRVPMNEILSELGISYRINGKTNTGLGRPKFKGGS